MQWRYVGESVGVWTSVGERVGKCERAVRTGRMLDGSRESIAERGVACVRLVLNSIWMVSTFELIFCVGE